MIIKSREEMKKQMRNSMTVLMKHPEMQEAFMQGFNKNGNSDADMKFELGFRVIHAADETSTTFIGVTPAGHCCGAFTYRTMSREVFLAEHQFNGPIAQEEVFKLIKGYHARVMNFGFEDENVENMYAKGIPKLEKMISDHEGMEVIRIVSSDKVITFTCGIKPSILSSPDHQERFDELMGVGKTIAFDITFYEPKQ